MKVLSTRSCCFRLHSAFRWQQEILTLDESSVDTGKHTAQLFRLSSLDISLISVIHDRQGILFPASRTESESIKQPKFRI